MTNIPSPQPAFPLGLWKSYKWLIVILAIAFLLRVLSWIQGAPIVAVDGSEYLCGARNLTRGLGYVGCYDGPELMYTPMYSLLIAALSFLVRDFELSAHLISVFFGTFLILPVFFIALRVYGRRAAYISAVLTALQPVLVKLGGSTYNEAVYLTLFMAGIWAGIRALEFRNWKYSCLTGIFFALACLTRPEAFAYPIFFAGAIGGLAILSRKPITTAAFSSLLVLGTFLLLVSPYAKYLYDHTGSLRLEGKWNINFTIGERIQQGLDFSHAAYGVGENSRESGPLLHPSQFAAYTPFHHSLRDKLSYLFHEAAVNRFDLYGQFSSYLLGDPLVFILVTIGLFRRSWSPRRLLHEMVLLVMCSSLLLLMLTAQHIERRYVFPLIPILIVWAAKGIDELGSWTRSLLARCKLPAFAHGLPAAGVQLTVLGSVLLISLYGSQSDGDFRVEEASNLPVKNAGLWLKTYDPGPKRIASWDARITWYADAAYLQFPNADSATTLRYFESQKPDYIYLSEHYSRPDPTMVDWLSHGIPDRHARLVYSATTGLGKIAIYRWSPPEASQQRPPSNPSGGRGEPTF